MMSSITPLHAIERIGHIEQIIGLKIISLGPPSVFVGELCEILDRNHFLITYAEVIGFESGKVFLLPFAKEPLQMGYQVRACGQVLTVKVGLQLLGKVVDALGTPFEGNVAFGNSIQSKHFKAINPLLRTPIEHRLLTGIHAIDCLFPLGKGQRIGIFAGSGVGKSVLLGMIAKRAESDVNIIALIGERGREVKDFIFENLDEKARKKSIIVVACSDEFALKRRQAIFTAIAFAEFFSQQGKQVLLFVDSITRFAMAQREIGLSLGEPPTARGYTPSVFSQLPEIVERAGNFKQRGSITAIFTVLVEGDDFNEPIADTMRSLLDGHIILNRQLAEKGHYPAIDVLQSISRLSHRLASPQEYELMKKLIQLFSLYHQNKDLIEVGAYKPGIQPKLDFAMSRIDTLQELLQQNRVESLPLHLLFQRIEDILNE